MAFTSSDPRTRLNRSLMAFIVLTPIAWGVLGQIQNTRALASTGSGQNTQAAANYNKATYYEQNQNYYNAVYYASQALAGGDAKAQITLDDASNALLQQAENQYQAGNITTAMNSFSLLANLTNTPSADQVKAQEYLTSSEDYSISVWYQNNKNYVNAFIYAERANSKGDPRAASLLKGLATQIESEAKTKLANGDEQGAKMRFQLLANSSEVADTVKQTAQAHLAQLKYYAVAKWYQDNGNPFNAVYYLNQASPNDQLVTSLMATVAKTLEGDADQAMKDGKVQQAIASYQLLETSSLTGNTIKQQAASKLKGHTEYAEAVWYKHSGNLFNAVYYASKASQDQDVLAGGYLATEATALLSEAKTDQQNGKNQQANAAFQLLATTPGIPSTVKDQAKSILYPPAPALTNGLNFTVDTSNHSDTIIHLGTPSQSGDTYVYKVSSDSSPVPTPHVGDSTSGWQTVSNSDSLKIADGTYVGVAEVDSSGKVVQFSNAKAETYITPDANETTISASPSSATLTGTSFPVVTITVQVKGSSGQNRHLGGDSISLYLYESGTLPSQITPVTDNGDGTYTAKIYTSIIGLDFNSKYTVKGTLNGQPIPLANAASFEFYDGSSGGGSTNGGGIAL